MAQQELRTIIALSGRVDNKFGAIGNELLLLGSQLDGLSSKIFNFGKDSVNAFAGYEDTMLLVEHIGDYSDKTMEALDDYNKTIAQTSKYTMDRAAQTELLIARLGLNLDQTKELMPAVLNTATAANIGLATSLNYLYYSVNALGEPISYANTLADQMAKAADVSAAGIDTIGQSLQRLGSGAKYFAGGSSEILAILAGISQFGQDMQGTNAGTQLRNFMLTLLAPTASKSKLMQELGVTEEAWGEFESYMEDAEINVTDTADAMNDLGLRMYDSRGKLKPAIQIIGELDAALNSLSEAEQKEYLGKLFGKRTTITAENLLAALETIIEYQRLIENESDGYAEAMAGAAESGLGGTMREFTASWAALKTTIGENISPEVGTVTDFFKDSVVAISNIDEVKLSALVGAAEGAAAAGPGLLILGAGFKLIGALGNPVGRTALSVLALTVAIGAAVKGITKWNEIEFEDKFGEMELDKDTLISHVNAISQEFTSAYEEVNKFSAALETAVSDYTTASTTLSSDLLTSMITGTTLTPEQIANIESLGKSMGDSLQAGLDASFDRNAEYLIKIYGEDAGSDPLFKGAVESLTKAHDILSGKAQTLGRELGEALGVAMDDGIITGDEYAAVMEKLQEYNEAMSLYADAQRAGDMEVALHKAQSVSWDSAADFLTEQQAIANAALEQAEEEYLSYVGSTKFIYETLINNAKDAAEAERYQQELENILAAAEVSFNAKKAAHDKGQSDIALAVFEGLLTGSDYGTAWPFLKNVLGNIDDMERDSVGALTLNDIDWAALDESGQLTKETSEMLRGMSGIVDEFEEIFAPYSDNPEIAKALEQMQYAYALGQLASSYYDRKEGFYDSEGTEDPFNEFSTAEQIERNWERAALKTSIEQLAAEAERLEAEIAERENRLAGNDRPWHYNLTGGEQADWNMLYGNVYGGNLYERQEAVKAELELLQQELWALGAEIERKASETIVADVEADLDKAELEAQLGEEPVAVPAVVEAEVEEETITNAFDEFAFPAVIDMEGMEEDAREAGSISGEALQESWGDPQLSATVDAAGITQGASGAGSDAKAALLASWGNPTLTAKVTYTGVKSGKSLTGFAEGGRATEASIFGEAGPEWAIPEEHTTRVAKLFDAARRGAGFTWPELIARNGGLNAGRKAAATVVYAPVIHASGGAADIEQLLLEDKERLENWWREKQMRDETEVYA